MAQPTGPLCSIGADASLTRTAFCTIYANSRDHFDRPATDPEAQWVRTWTYTFAHEVIATDSKWTLTRRLRALANGAYRIATTARPDVVIVEEPGFVVAGHGLGPITTLGRAQGAIIAGLPPDTENAHPIMVQRLRSALGLKVPRGKGQAKAATLAFVEAHGITVPRRGAAHDDDIADAYALSLYGLTLLGVPLPGTLPTADTEKV